MSENKVNSLCKDCINYEMFKDKCFFYWERKRECSNHAKSPGNIKFKRVEFSE